MYRLWVVDRKSLKPLALSASYKSASEALGSAGRILKGFGAPALDAQNLTSWAGSASLVVYDPTGSIPHSAVIEGAQLMSSGEDPSPLDPGDNVGPCPTLPPITE